MLKRSRENESLDTEFDKDKENRGGLPYKNDSKKRTSFQNLTPEAVLQNHPINHIIPIQSMVPLIVPYDTNIPSDTILFSQDDVNDNSTENNFLSSYTWKSEHPDLKFLKFKRPTIQNNQNPLEINETNAIIDEISGNITAVSKSDYLKCSMQSTKMELLSNNNNSASIHESETENENTLKEITALINFQDTPAPDPAGVRKSDTVDENIEKPDFLYDSSVTQNDLIVGVVNDFISDVTKLHEGYNHLGDSASDDDIWISYNMIFQNEQTIASVNVLTSIKTKLLQIKSHDILTAIDPRVYSWLFNICISTIKESFPIDWEVIFTSEDIYNTGEYQNYIETVIQCCSMILIMYSNSLTDQITKHENGLSIVTDLISTFGVVIKGLFQIEEFIELPDFFIPIIKSYSLMINTLCENLIFLPFTETLIARLEYISFDAIFADITYTKDRITLNIALEDLRSEFAQLIISIYRKYEDQRAFIFNEIVENINTLNPLKSKSKNYRLNCGITVQLVSYMILSLIECHSSYTEDFDYSKWEYLNIDHKTKAKNSQLKEMNESYWNSVNYQYESMQKAVNNFVNSLLRKIIALYTPTLRKIIENIFADIFIMMELPEFSSSIVFLDSILTNGLSLCNNSGDSALTSAYALLFELIGTIGSKIMQIKGEGKNVLLNSDLDIKSLEESSDKLKRVIFYLKFKYSNPELYRFYLMLYLVQLNKLKGRLEEIVTSKGNEVIGDQMKLKKKLLNKVSDTIFSFREIPYIEKASNDLDSITEIQIRETFKDSLLSTQFMNRYNEVFTFILMSLNDPKAKTRTLSIKTLTLLINKEPELLQDERLRKMIKQKLEESFTTVIDATLELLLKVLELKPEYISEYYEIIIQKVSESSINVKRKSINLISYMFKNLDDIKIKAKLIVSLLGQLDEEEDRIVDTVCYNLCDLLLLELGELKLDAGSSDSVLFQTKAEQTIRVLCDVFLYGTASINQFERFLVEKVIHKSKFNKNIKEILDASLDALVDYMLSMITDSETVGVENISTESIMKVLSSLIRCDEQLISQHQLIIIQPYIVNDDLSNEICYHALQILKLALNHHHTLNHNFVEACKTSLMARLTKFNSKELDSAIQCVWKLFLIDDNTQGVSKACVSSLRMLLKFINDFNDSGSNLTPAPTIPRLLYLVGNFGRYCAFERDRQVFEDAKLGLREDEPISVFLLKYLLKFCDSSIAPYIRKIAIKNTLNVCVSHPKLFFTVPVSQLVDSVFKKTDLILKNIVIGSLLTLLENEEQKMIQKNGLGVKRSSSIKLDVAVFHGNSSEYVNDGICSTLVQKYMPNILNICLMKNNEVAMNSIEFLRMIIKFGFSNPKVCFPTVVALECSRSKYIKQVAIEMHKFLFEKFESLMESTYWEAFKKTIGYVMILYSLDELKSCDSFLRTFFRIVKSRKSKQRSEKFIQSILRVIGNISMHKLQKVDKEGLRFIEYQIVFLCININEIEFASQLEVLTIISFIEKIILTEEGNVFGSQFKLMMDLFDDDDDNKYRGVVIGKFLVSLNCLVKCLTKKYSISSDLILKFQESVDKKEFQVSVGTPEPCVFFEGEIKKVLSDTSMDLTLLHNKLLEFNKN